MSDFGVAYGDQIPGEDDGEASEWNGLTRDEALAQWRADQAWADR
jgi:hypothetical protein